MTEPLVFLRYPLDYVDITTHFAEWLDTGNGPYQHRGIDLHADEGTPVYAPAAGRSVDFTNDGTFGHHSVTLHHEQSDPPLFTLYAHLSKRVVNVGDWVEAGALIGYSGHEGFYYDGSPIPYAPHLHWQPCVNSWFPVDISYSRDPLQYLVTEDSPMTPQEKAEFAALKTRVDTMEAIVIENGFDAICRPGTEDLFPAGTPVVPEGQEGRPRIRLTGDAASEYAKRRGFSLALAIESVQK